MFIWRHLHVLQKACRPRSASSPKNMFSDACGTDQTIIYSYGHGQQPPSDPVPQCTTSLSFSRSILVPTSISFIHPFLDRPFLLLPSPLANIIWICLLLITLGLIITMCPKNSENQSTCKQTEKGGHSSTFHFQILDSIRWRLIRWDTTEKWPT